MTLSDKSFQNIASALVPDVITYIEQDERYVTFMTEVITDALGSFLGNMDEDLKCELSVAIMDKICFVRG
jgi:hypothetical protein